MRVRALIVPGVIVIALVGGCSKPTPTLSTDSPSPSTAPTQSSVEELTADEILAASKAALSAAGSFRLKLSARVAIFTSESTIDYVGADAKGTQKQFDSVVEFVLVDGSLYVKGGDSYWSGISSLGSIALVSGKWVKVDPTNPNHSHLVPTTDLAVFEFGAVTKAGTSTIDGKPAVTLKGDDGTIYVAAQGEPYPLRIEGTQQTEFGPATVVVNFSDFGTVTTVIEPPTGEIVDLSAG